MTVLWGQLWWYILSLSTFVFAFSCDEQWTRIAKFITSTIVVNWLNWTHCCHKRNIQQCPPLTTMPRPPLISIIRRTISWHPEIAFLPRTETSIPLSQTTSPTWQIHESYSSRRPAECQISSQSEVQSCLCHCLSVTHCSGVNDLYSPSLSSSSLFFFDSLYTSRCTVSSLRTDCWLDYCILWQTNSVGDAIWGCIRNDSIYSQLWLNSLSLEAYFHNYCRSTTFFFSFFSHME